MIKRLLIANRGEIACRIIATARRMGIHTIALYSDADVGARHVRLADEAHHVGGAEAADSYLRTGRILKLAKQAGADAIHPGYGFLSENADFAELTRDGGMAFVGPPADAIRAMGLKDRAKKIMADAGVPVVPGFHGSNQDAEFLKRKAYETGYPVMIKAVAGGGGKGMRLVNKALEFDDALTAARREAKAAFGNDDVLIEKFIASPRHIEVQVFADSHGNVVHLFERDCSLQRRHQKVIEEAPAPEMPENVRAAMGKAACDAALAVGYEGAGTVEFIVDGEGGLSEDGFWFMEMNTRLQVEHPVTEMVTGTDLVEWQLRIASGEKLPVGQDDLTLSGHAVEARLYAEDPANGFLPSTGRLIALELAEGEGIRVDAGVETGDAVSPFYDPMIAKVIAHGADRKTALDRLQSALEASAIAGPRTNITFLSRLLANAAFRAGDFDTGLIDRNLESLTPDVALGDDLLAAALEDMMLPKVDPVVGNSANPWEARDGFQINGVREHEAAFLIDGEARSVTVRIDAHGLAIVNEQGEAAVSGRANARIFRDGAARYAIEGGVQHLIEPLSHGGDGQGVDATGDGILRVPMHGKVVAVTVGEGDDVEQGDLLFAVEAMKMEQAVLAPYDGKVVSVSVTVGQQAAAGLVAVVLESGA